ncbi:hypothetical protein [Actinophytocola sp.]|uniref:hypothetical protein n=1 Tax=Actinophytocola sp. TaxID=1872138 RepID=UPI003D6AC67F
MEDANRKMAGDVSRAIADVTRVLAADGYEMAIETVAAGNVAVSIVAGPDACADCLVPKAIMLEMIKDRLPATVRHVSLRYPNE